MRERSFRSPTGRAVSPWRNPISARAKKYILLERKKEVFYSMCMTKSHVTSVDNGAYSLNIPQPKHYSLNICRIDSIDSLFNFTQVDDQQINRQHDVDTPSYGTRYLR